MVNLDEYRKSAKGIIELLEHARDKEQFNYILGMSYTESHNKELLEYLVSKDYSVEDYASIDVEYMIFQYKELFEYLVTKSDSENIKQLLEKVAYVDENIANIVSQRDDRNELIKTNYHLKDKIVVKKIIDYFEEKPESIDFGFVELCNLDTESIKKLLNLGYKISKYSPYNIMQNNEIMKEEFLKSIKTQNEEILENIDKELKNIPGGYAKLYKSTNINLFCDEFIKNFEKKNLNK